MWWLNLICVVVLIAIAYQDIKDRAVSWFFFLVLAIALGALHYFNSLFEVFLTHVLINFGFVLFVVLLLFGYTKLRGKLEFSKAIGTGDIVMFIALSPAMASVSFMVCFVFSILLALILSLVLNRNDEKHTPLAGYMAVFFLIIYLAHWSSFIDQLYTI